MTPTSLGSAGGASPASGGFGPELLELRRRIEIAHDQPELVDPALVQDLETAYEELRVADEEVRAQQDQIATLLEGRQLLLWQQERALSLLPVPCFITDREGLVSFVNAAASVLLQMRVARVVGKPLMVFFSLEDRPTLRRLLGAHRRDGHDFRHTATLMGRHGAATPVECVVTPVPGQDGSTTWMLLSAVRPPSAPSLALPAALAEIASLSQHHDQRNDVLRAAAVKVDAVLGPEVSLSLVVGTPLAPEVLASTSRLAQSIDGAQVAAGEGPCATAFETAEVVIAPDIRSDARWPRLAPLLDPEVRGVVAIPVEIGETVLGALNLYTTAEVEPELADHGELLAATIAAVLHEIDGRAQLEQLSREMEAALQSRASIEQAKGIVMAHRGVGADEAFAHLVSLSSSRHQKLRDVASQIVADATRDH